MKLQIFDTMFIMGALRQKIMKRLPTILSLLFLILFSGVMRVLAVPPSTEYAPGATLDPNCAPGDTNCTVSVEPALTTGTTITSGDSPYTVLSTDQLIYANTASGDITVTLPSLSSFSKKRTIVVVKTSSSNTLYIDAATSDFINETTQLDFTDNRRAVRLESIGANRWLGTFNFDALGVSPITVTAATTAALSGSPSYSNGSSGVGATLTGTAALGTINGVTLSVSDRILVKNQTTALQNGVYSVTASGGSSYTLTRTTDSDATSELDPQIVIPTQGTTANKGKQFSQTTASPTVGTSDISYSSISAGNNAVTQQASGTQATGQVPFWTGTARQLSKSSSAFTFGSVATNSLSISGSYYVGSDFFGTQDVSNTNLRLGQGTAVPTTGTGNVFLGVQAGQSLDGATTSNVVIGTQAAYDPAVTTGNKNVVIGTAAGGEARLGDGNILIGYLAGFGLSSSGSSGSRNIIIGDTADGAVSGLSSSIAIGSNTSLTASNQLVLGGSNAVDSGKITDVYIGNGVTHHASVSSAADVAINATGGTGSNKAGGGLTIAGGKGTGTGNGGSLTFKVTYPGSTGSSLNSLSTIGTIIGDNNDSSGTQDLIAFSPTVNQSGTAGYTGFEVNVTETATGSGTKRLFDVQVGGATKFNVANNGDVTVTGSATTCTIGNGTGATNCSSDRRLKTNIETLSDSLSLVRQLRPVTFNWIDKKKEQDTKIGFIAQEVEEIFPSFVANLPDGHLGMDYAALVSPAIGAIQELDLKVSGIEALVSEESIAAKIKNILADASEKVINGIVTFVEIVAEKITAKKIVTEEIEMKDKVTGETYCLTIESGDWQKTLGECGEEVIVPPIEPDDGGETPPGDINDGDEVPDDSNSGEGEVLGEDTEGGEDEPPVEEEIEGEDIPPTEEEITPPQENEPPAPETAPL